MAELAPDIVFHLAAQSLVRTSYQQPVPTFETNVLGTIHVMEAARVARSVRALVVVTSDNPRSEDPQSIIEQIAAGMQDAAKARRIEDRASAILQAIRSAAREDVIVLAGKGHEATQEIMGKKRAFSDQDHARLALGARATHARGGGE